MPLKTFNILAEQFLSKCFWEINKYIGSEKLKDAKKPNAQRENQ